MKARYPLSPCFMFTNTHTWALHFTLLWLQPLEFRLIRFLHHCEQLKIWESDITTTKTSQMQDSWQCSTTPPQRHTVTSCFNWSSSLFQHQDRYLACSKYTTVCLVMSGAEKTHKCPVCCRKRFQSVEVIWKKQPDDWITLHREPNPFIKQYCKLWWVIV